MPGKFLKHHDLNRCEHPKANVVRRGFFHWVIIRCSLFKHEARKAKNPVKRATSPLWDHTKQWKSLRQRIYVRLIPLPLACQLSTTPAADTRTKGFSSQNIHIRH